MNKYIKKPYRTNLFIYEPNSDWQETYNPENKSKEETANEHLYSNKSEKSKEYSLNKFLVNDY